MAMNILWFIFVITLSTGAFFLLTKLFAIDDNRILSNTFAFGIALISIIAFDIVFLIVFKRTPEFYVSCLLNFYLTLTAYIDYQTMNVYRFPHIIFGLLGVCLLIAYPTKHNGQYLGIIVYLIFIVMISKIGGLGKGDLLTLCVVIPYIKFLYFGDDVLIILLVNTVVFNILFILTNIKSLDMKRIKLRAKSPLTPSIALATMTIIVIFRIFKINI